MQPTTPGAQANYYLHELLRGANAGRTVTLYRGHGTLTIGDENRASTFEARGWQPVWTAHQSAVKVHWPFRTQVITFARRSDPPLQRWTFID